MKARVLQRFEDSHQFVAEVPKDVPQGAQIPVPVGTLTVKQRISDSTALCVHVATFPKGSVLTNDEAPDLEMRCHEGSPGYPGWVKLGLVEVIK